MFLEKKYNKWVNVNLQIHGLMVLFMYKA